MNRDDWRRVNIQYVYPAIDAWQKGKLTEAEAIFLKGLGATNNDGFIALNYAQLLEETKRLDEANKMYEIAWSTLSEPKNKGKAKKGLERVASKIKNISSDS
jgi:tetratricopeptide (TPR) repeat protein